ncbi:MAG: methyltransferase [Nitrospinota bacterium]
MSAAKTIKNNILIQNDSGYRYSIEPFLLADFARLLPGQEVLDIGTGCGIIPLLMLHREPELRITGIEIQESAAANARENASGNQEKIKIIQGDFLETDFNQNQFDLIVSNPPYRKINSGRINPDEGKAIARHELKLSLPTLLDHARPCLKRNGHIALAYPPLRLQETLRELEKRELFPARIRFIHGNRDAEAKIFLVDAIKEKKSDLIVDSPLYVYNKDGSYSQEMQEIYDSFNCADRPDDLGEK